MKIRKHRSGRYTISDLTGGDMRFMVQCVMRQAQGFEVSQEYELRNQAHRLAAALEYLTHDYSMGNVAEFTSGKAVPADNYQIVPIKGAPQ